MTTQQWQAACRNALDVYDDSIISGTHDEYIQAYHCISRLLRRYRKGERSEKLFRALMELK